MNIIKHGYRYTDLHKTYKFACEVCGCEFEAERYEITPERIDYSPLTDYKIKKYEENGIDGMIKCPECSNIVHCKMELTHDEEKFITRWKEKFFMINLKECKMCNGTPHIESFMIYPQSTAPYRVYFAVCNHCGARTKALPSRLMAILQWNNLVKP